MCVMLPHSSSIVCSAGPGFCFSHSCQVCVVSPAVVVVWWCVVCLFVGSDLSGLSSLLLAASRQDTI